MVAEKEDCEDESLRLGCPVLVTERLVMRRPHLDDVPELAALANNRRIADMLPRMPHPYGEAEARAFVAAASTASHLGDVYALTIAESGAFIGCTGLSPAERGLSLGYWIGEPYWGHGYATEAAHALIDAAFRATAVEEVQVACRVTNTASRRVIHKCGFQYAAQGMMHFITAGQVPVERYRLDRATWIGLRSWSADKSMAPRRSA